MKVICAVALTVIAAGTTSAQGKAGPAIPVDTIGFTTNYTGIGAVVGLGNIGAASAAFGGRFERAIKALPDMGDGILGISVDADYYGYSISQNSSLTYIPIGVAANYHFKLDDRKWDPFIGLGVGYSMERISFGGGISGSNNSAYLISRVGCRYFFNDRLAVQLDGGAGAAAASFGLMFTL